MEHHNEHHNHNGSSETSHLRGLEGIFDTYLRIKAPFQLPVKARDFIVQYGPWISLVLLIIAAVAIIPLLALALGLTVITMPFQAAAGTVYVTTGNYLQLGIGLVSMVMQGIAIPGLLKRKLSGWHMAYYASLLSVLGSLVSGHIVSAILSLLISMYILFQVRSYYK